MNTKIVSAIRNHTHTRADQFLKRILNKAAYISLILIENIADPLMKWNKLWQSCPARKFTWPEGLTADVKSDNKSNQDPVPSQNYENPWLDFDKRLNFPEQALGGALISFFRSQIKALIWWILLNVELWKAFESGLTNREISTSTATPLSEFHFKVAWFACLECRGMRYVLMLLIAWTFLSIKRITSHMNS